MSFLLFTKTSIDVLVLRWNSWLSGKASVWGVQHLVWEGGFQISAYSNAIQGYKPLYDTIHDQDTGLLKGKDIALSFPPEAL